MLQALVHKHPDLLPILASNGADPDDSDGFGETALGHAVEFCDSNVVKQLLELGADPEVESLMTKPLVQAALFGKTDNVRVLLEHGANPNSPQASGLTALLEATRYGYREIVELLLKHGADLGYKGPGGLNASAVAKRAGKRDMVELLTSRQPKSRAPSTPNAIEKTGLLLWRSVKSGRVADLEGLADKAVDVNASNSNGDAPLHAATRAGHATVVTWLLKHGADPNKKITSVGHDQRGFTPLHEGAVRGHDKVAQLLLTYKAKIDAKTTDGRTALMLAADAGHFSVAKLLLGRGADLKICNQTGETAFTVAVAKGHLRIARLLLTHGADINHIVEAFDITALMLAAVERSHSRVDFLLKAGADANVRSSRGDTALHKAVMGGAVFVTKVDTASSKMNLTQDTGETIEIVKRLLNAGADPSLRDSQRKTPLDWAKTLGLGEVVEVMEGRRGNRVRRA